MKIINRIIKLNKDREIHRFYCHKIWQFIAVRESEYSWWFDKRDDHKKEFDNNRFWFQRPLKNKWAKKNEK